MDDRLKGRKNICMMTKTCWALRKVLCSFLFAAVGLWTLNANMLHVQAETAGNVIYAFEKTDEVSIPVKASTDNIIYAFEYSQNGPGGGWKDYGNGIWKFVKNGSELSDCWELIDGKWYLFGTDGRMLTGWQTVNGVQYYLSENSTAGHPMGSCYIGEKTPDGCTVDERGAMIHNPNTLTEGLVRANPYGNQTCVELSLSEQRIYVYQGAELVLTSPCVTGNVAGGHATPAGDYKIFAKEENRTLRGYNDDGTKYNAFVNFWMPFNGGIGFHDANWRNSYGGDIYVSGGSHGCVNLPYDRAAALYGMAYIGMPVHVHN